MAKKITALTLVVLLLNLLSVAPVAAATKLDAEAKFTAKVKSAIAKLGTGTQARVEVSLRDKTKLKGYVREADEIGFVVVDAKTGTATTLAYPQVQTVKGNNLATGVKIAIGVGIAVGVLLLIAGLCAISPSCSGS
ncbi:MAG: hypothetical protein ACJ74W_20350 [Pyrinomonadaceae bacterium]